MSQSSLRLVESSSMDKDKSKALDAALSQIERAFGKGSIMRLGKGQQPVEIETVSTGSLGLDIALGVGGLPRGRTPSPKPRRRGASAPSWTRSTRSIRSMPASSV